MLSPGRRVVPRRKGCPQHDLLRGQISPFVCFCSKPPSAIQCACYRPRITAAAPVVSGNRIWFVGSTHLFFTLPRIFDRGIAPYWRLSYELVQLSPTRKYCFGGTVYGNATRPLPWDFGNLSGGQYATFESARGMFRMLPFTTMPDAVSEILSPGSPITRFKTVLFVVAGGSKATTSQRRGRETSYESRSTVTCSPGLIVGVMAEEDWTDFRHPVTARNATIANRTDARMLNH